MKTDCLLDYSMVAVEQEKTVNLLIKLQAPREKKDQSQPPLNICLVLDKSGSMSGPKLTKTKEAAKLIINRLMPEDSISIITFDDQVQTLIVPQTVNNSQEKFTRLIEHIYAGGGTNLSGGLLKGIEYLTETRSEESINRLLILTDGCANKGITNDGMLVNIARSAKDEDSIITTTLGFGIGFNEDLLIEMAKATTGNFYFIERSDDAPKFFAEELHGMQQLVAQNISITIQSTEKVTAVRQVTEHPQVISQDKLLIEMGDAQAGEEKRLLLKLEVPGIKTIGQCKIADMEMRFIELSEESASLKSVSQPINVNVVDADQENQAEVEVLQELAIQESASARRSALEDADKAIKHADVESAKSAAKRLRSAARKLEALPPEIRNDVINNEIRDLNRQADALEATSDHVKDKDYVVTNTTVIRKTLATNTMKIVVGKLNKHHQEGAITPEAYKLLFENLNKNKDNPES